MKPVGLMAVIAALLLPVIDACAEPSPRAARVGDTYEIVMNHESSQHSSAGSSGSSQGGHAYVERVIAVREGAVELEYDIPTDATAEDRARQWQFPARVFKPSRGSMQLLNRAELEARLERWLKSARWTRAVCGRWIFTWNAFLIECDPQSVIETIELLQLTSAEIRDGAPYQDADARGPGRMARKAAGPNGATFTVEMPVDPDAVHRDRAEADVAVGQMAGKPVTLDVALRERGNEAVSGTISVTFDMDSAGNLSRRTKVTKLRPKTADGHMETETTTETVERRLLSQR
jgi:hypothetical protein